MAVLVDTNVLLRRTQPTHEHHMAAVESVAGFLASGESVCFTPQNIAEFWTVATRPLSGNGLGFSPEIALAEVIKIEAVLTLLPDSPNTYAEWKRLISRYKISGVRTHDARLVAAMNVHGIRRILTFDKNDFAAFDLEVIHPSEPIAAD